MFTIYLFARDTSNYAILCNNKLVGQKFESSEEDDIEVSILCTDCCESYFGDVSLDLDSFYTLDTVNAILHELTDEITIVKNDVSFICEDFESSVNNVSRHGCVAAVIVQRDGEDFINGIEFETEEF